MAQHVFNLSFFLQGEPSSALTEFVSPEAANIVLTSKSNNEQTGRMSSGVKNYHQITIRLPMLKQKVTFSVTNDRGEINRCATIYNYASSLDSCVIVHSVDTEKKKFNISILTQSTEYYNTFQLMCRQLS